MIELVDCHTHTVFSDGKSTFAENMVAALDRGLTTVCCTDHWGRPDFVDCSIEEARLGDYAQEITWVRDDFPELDIVYGLEADWYEGCAADLTETRGKATYLLGSVHYLREMAIDWDEDMRIWEQLGANGVWQLYVEEWCKAAMSGLFDCMAHPDLPRLFGPQGYAPTCDLKPLWDEMAAAAKQGGVHVEINTAAAFKNLGDFYPESGLLQRFCAAGVPVTVGSDAHHSSRIGDGIAQAYEYAQRIGYASIDVPTIGGDWRTLSFLP